jgi:hypothetical protein
MKMPGGRKKKPPGRVIWSLPSGVALTPATAPQLERILKPGAITVLHYHHDADCPQLAGGACQCDPDMELREITRDDLA